MTRRYTAVTKVLYGYKTNRKVEFVCFCIEILGCINILAADFVLLYVQNSGARYKCVILGPSGVKPDMGICVSNCTESLLYGCIVCSLRLGD